MKKIQVFPTLKMYRKFIFSEVVENKEFHKHPFYKGLVSFIIDHRTPIFFEATEEYEYAHFTQYFNWVLKREYDNSYMKDLYFLHDFVHMIFDNPLSPLDYSLEKFREIVVNNERVAANDTEIMTYYRLPTLRKKTLAQPILYDFVQKKYKKQPAVTTLFDLRNKLIETDFIPVYLNNDMGRIVISFLKRFKDNNKTWSRLWRENFPSNAIEKLEKPMFLSLKTYQSFLENYKPINSQELYEQNIIFNIRLALKMIGQRRLPRTMKECLKKLPLLEGKVLMNNVAEEYHRLYATSKSKAMIQQRHSGNNISAKETYKNLTQKKGMMSA